MSSDRMREEFEAWFSDNYRWHIENGKEEYRLNRFEQPPNQYIGEIAHHDWRVWQASRAALVVELPEQSPETPFSRHMVMDSSSVIEAIESAGVRVKP